MLMTLPARLIVWVLVTCSLFGCASVDAAEYRAEKPVPDVAQYFNGTLDGCGMFQDRSGKVVRRFYARIGASGIGNQGIHGERFEYPDGTRQQRIWIVVRDGDRDTATAGDVVGTAQSQAAGNALRWSCALALPGDDKMWNMDIDDWMFLIDERTMLSRSTMSKFGFKGGQ